jgi:hypothetical protein
MNMRKALLSMAAIATLFVTGSQALAAGLNCVVSEGNFPKQSAYVENLGVGRTRIDGVIYKGYTVMFYGTTEPGVYLAKVWGPASNPSDMAGSAVLQCTK